MIPLLKPTIRTVRDGEQACYFVSSEQQVFRCRGASVPILVERVLPLVDGQRRLDQIVSELEGVLSEKAVRGVFELLTKHNVVIDLAADEPAGDGASAEHRALHAFLTRHSAEPNRMFNRLRRACVAVRGTGAVLEAAAAALSTLGVGEVRVFGELAALPERATQLGQSSPEAVDAGLAGAALAVAIGASEFDDSDEIASFARRCLTQGLPCLLVRLTHDGEAWIGPLQVPGGPCIECLQVRIRSNLKGWHELELFSKHVRQGLVLPIREPLPRPFIDQVAASTSIEVLKFITGVEATPLTRRCRILDLVTQEVSLHSVLKVPHCRTCSAGSEHAALPWNADEVELDRTLIPNGQHTPEVHFA